MKRTLLFLFSLLAVVFGSYAINVPLAVNVTEPADRNNLSEATTFTLEIAGEGDMAEYPLMQSATNPYVTNGTDRFEGQLVKVNNNSSFDLRYTLTFSPAITTEGTYELVLPKGLFYVYTAMNQSVEYVLPDFFSIGGEAPQPEPSIFDNTADFVFEPAAGTEVSEIASVKFSIAGHDVFDAENPHEAYLLNKTTGKQTKCSWYDTASDWTCIEFVFSPAVTEAGDYEFVIPVNAVLDPYNQDDYNKTEITTTYTIAAAEVPVVDFFEGAEFTEPTPGSVVESLSHFTVVLPNKGDFEVEVDTDRITVVGNGTSFKGYNGVSTAEGFEFSCPEITAPGRYTVTVPVEALTIDGKTNELPISAVFTIEDNTTPDLPSETMDVVYYYSFRDADGNILNAGDTQVSSVASIAINVPFENTDDSWTWNEDLISQIVLSDGTNEFSPASCDLENPMRDPNNFMNIVGIRTLRVYFKPVVEEAGVYSLSLPEGLVYTANGVAAALVYDDFVAIKTISTADPFSGMFFAVPEGDTVEGKISEIVIEFPALQEGDVLEIVEVSDISVATGDYEDFKPSLYNLRVEGNTIKADVDHADRDGFYTFIMWPGAVSINGVLNTVVLQKVVNVDNGVGVAAVSAGAETFTVVDLAGRVLVKNGTADDLRALESGIYLVNGRKVSLRK